MLDTKKSSRENSNDLPKESPKYHRKITQIYHSWTTLQPDFPLAVRSNRSCQTDASLQTGKTRKNFSDLHGLSKKSEESGAEPRFYRAVRPRQEEIEYETRFK